ncbi:hypothetical protein IMY05_015G0073800 [Salix suchowensis]|nr:hypothetical protein IMY05_015G0073800 [Salix suchowensis]
MNSRTPRVWSKQNGISIEKKRKDRVRQEALGYVINILLYMNTRKDEVEELYRFSHFISTLSWPVFVVSGKKKTKKSPPMKDYRFTPRDQDGSLASHGRLVCQTVWLYVDVMQAVSDEIGLDSGDWSGFWKLDWTSRSILHWMGNYLGAEIVFSMPFVIAFVVWFIMFLIL